MTEQESTNECIKCGVVAGYHCEIHHVSIKDRKNKEDMKGHDNNCVWLNPLIE